MSDGTTGPVIVRGVPVDQGKNPPLRLEIRDLQSNHPEQWTLYLLGMERFQNEAVISESKPLSYFQISGIHGEPYTKWPNEPWNNMRGVQRTGFCTHTSILFLPWHRPYLALFETELHKHVTAIANQYTEAEGRSRYVEAAKSFRIPYWDWARPDRPIFPNEALIDGPTLKVIRPGSGGQSTDLRSNPLASYLFKSLGQSYRIDEYPGTVRYPNERDPSGQMIASMEEYFNENQAEKNLTERVVYILQSYQRFGPMSNNAFPSGRPEIYGSLEDIHNTFHGLSGGDGHMSFVNVSAFDPIFWLHHTNIDRLFSIWQALHESDAASTYVEPNPSINGTFTTPAASIETKDTLLTPFNNTENTFWTADQVRSTKTFGYAYPETQDWRFTSREAYKQDIRNQLRRIYGVGSLATLVSSPAPQMESDVNEINKRAAALIQSSKQPTNANIFLQLNQQGVLRDGPGPSSRKLEDLVVQNKYLEWLTNIKAQKHSLDGAYSVHVFLGPVEESNPSLWPASPSHVGTFIPLGQNPKTGCEKCQADQAAQQQISGQIPLTIALAERYLAGMISGLTPEHVVPYLQRNLHWRVALQNGTQRSRADVDSLVVSVVSNEVTLPEDPSELPVYAQDVTVYPEITTRTDGSGRGEGTGLTDQTQT